MAIVNGRQMNFEKKKTVIFMIFFTLYWMSGTKEYVGKRFLKQPACKKDVSFKVDPSFLILILQICKFAKCLTNFISYFY